jgi:hypothetical protein
MTTSKFTVGEVVQNDAIYIRRAADDVLFELCARATLAYVLAPRQMGKTSLVVRTAARLQKRGVACVLLTLYEADITAEQWYLRLLAEIAEQLGLRTDPDLWWRQHTKDRGPSQRFRLFLETVLLAEVSQPVVIFIDEIDLTIGLSFTDEFFSTIRSLYEERPRKPALKRISFVLIGVASPSELIHDPLHTPFNIGHPVEMTDFTLAEADQLAQGFIETAPLDQARRVLEHILHWTHGHPYLTQRLCRALLAEATDWNESGVAALVQRTFLSQQGADDPNLHEVRRMVTRRAADPYETLSTYQDILRGKRVADEPLSPVKALLKLSGLVQATDSRLVVRNRIYRSVFDERWVREQQRLLPLYWPRRLQQTLRYIAYLLLVPLILALAFAGYQWDRANVERVVALEAAMTAESAQRSEQFARTTAEVARVQAEQQRMAAEASALTLHALARNREDPDFSLRVLLSAADRGRTPLVDQAMRQMLEQQPCEKLNLHVYDVVWPASKPIWLIDAADGMPVSSQALTTSLVMPLVTRFGQPGDLLSSAGNSILAWASEDTAQVLRPFSNEGPIKLGDTGGKVLRAAWAPGGRRIVTISETSTRVWDATNGKLLHTLVGHSASVTSVAWSGNDQRLATADRDGIVRVWLSGLVQPPEAFNTNAGEIIDLEWSFDGTRLATAGNDGTVGIWDTSGQLVLTLDTQDRPVRAVRWSADMRHLLTIGDKLANVWDAATGAKIAALNMKSPFAAAAWSPDNRHFLIADADGWVCIYGTIEQMLASPLLENIERLSLDEERRLLEELLPTPIPPAGTSTETRTPSPTDTPTATVPVPPPDTTAPLPGLPVAPDPPTAVPTSPTVEITPATAVPTPSTVEITPTTAVPTSPTVEDTPTTAVPTSPTVELTPATAVLTSPTVELTPATAVPEPTAVDATPVTAVPEPTIASEEPTAISPTTPADARPTDTTEPAAATMTIPTDQPATAPTTNERVRTVHRGHVGHLDRLPRRA